MADAPQAPTLRPMSVADLVDEIFRLYRRNFALFFGISALVWLPASIVYIVLNVAFFGGLTPTDFAQLGQNFVILMVAGVVGLLALPVLFASLTAAVSSRYIGQEITVDGAVGRGLRCYWRIVGGYLLVFLALLLIGGSPFAAAIGLGLAGLDPLGAVVGIVGAIVAIVAVVWFTVTWSFIGQVIVVEDSSVLPSFDRSRALVSGSRWRVIGINLLLGLIQAVLFSVPSAFVAVILAPLSGTVGPALSQLVTAVAQIAFYPVQLGTLTLLYYDLRVRKEAFDLTLAAERLPAS